MWLKQDYSYSYLAGFKQQHNGDRVQRINLHAIHEKHRQVSVENEVTSVQPYCNQGFILNQVTKAMTKEKGLKR